jgi:hypothetical protein
MELIPFVKEFFLSFQNINAIQCLHLCVVIR